MAFSRLFDASHHFSRPRRRQEAHQEGHKREEVRMEKPPTSWFWVHVCLGRWKKHIFQKKTKTRVSAEVLVIFFLLGPFGWKSKEWRAMVPGFWDEGELLWRLFFWVSQNQSKTLTPVLWYTSNLGEAKGGSFQRKKKRNLPLFVTTEVSN